MQNKLVECIYTGAKDDKHNMLKFVLGPNSRIYFDLKQNLPGKHVYIVNSKNVLDKVISANILNDNFSSNEISDDLIFQVEKQYLDSALNTLSLAKKSGSILLGKRQIKEYIALNRNNASILLLQAKDASKSEKFIENDKTKIFEVFSSDMLSKACGKENLVYILVQDRFAKLIEEIISKYQIYMNN